MLLAILCLIFPESEEDTYNLPEYIATANIVQHIKFRPGLTGDRYEITDIHYIKVLHL